MHGCGLYYNMLCRECLIQALGRMCREKKAKKTILKREEKERKKEGQEEEPTACLQHIL